MESSTRFHLFASNVPSRSRCSIIMLSLLLVSSCLVFDVSMEQQLAKRHNNNNEMNTVILPSSLCDGGARSLPLGMESGQIDDKQITASSSYNEQSVGPKNARLNREIAGGAWCPKSQLSAASSGQEWIQVNFGEYQVVVTGISTQGRFANGVGVEFAEGYWIEYSRDNGTTWNKWTDINGDHKLVGNHDSYTPHMNNLSHPLVGINLIRIVPFANYQRTSCLRFELYGCRHNHQLPVSYSMPVGFKGSSFGDLRDLTYDGTLNTTYGYLTGGLGQLTDGIKGDDNYKVNYGYEWIGWRADGSDLSMIFKFGSIVNFTSASFYCHNLFRKEVQVFSGAKVWFSYDGEIWSRRPVEFEYMPDLALENARDVVLHLHQRAGMYIKFDLCFASKWMLISEVTFNTSPVEDNFTVAFEHLELPFDALLPISTAINGERGPFSQATFFIVFGVLFTVLCSVVLFLLRIHLKRKEKAGHIVVCMKDLATTPLYCEPKDFSSTSSTISNTVIDPEYAVPDVALPNIVAGAGLAATLRHNQANSGNGGHLNTNLNMFGAGFTRIFMGGNLKGNNNNNNNKTTAPIPVHFASQMSKNSTTLSAANISTSNVAYSSQQYQYLNESNGKMSNYNVNSSHNVPVTSLAINVSPSSVTSTGSTGTSASTASRQYYASTDLILKSPKLQPKNQHHYQQSIESASSNPSLMTSNTIYNRRKLAAGINDESMTTNGNTLKLKYSSSSGMGSSELNDDMKCIPEVSECDIEIIQKQYGYSRYGEVLLGRFRDYDTSKSTLTSANNNTNNLANNYRTKSSPSTVAGRYGPHGFSNDFSPETEIVNGENGNGKDKTGYYNSVTSAHETLVILKTLEKEKLKNEFLHEMKSKWFISAKSERVAKLIGYLSTPRYMSMVVECGDCDLSHFLRNCDKKSVGMQALLHIGSEVAAGMKYLESLGYVHRDLSARNCIIYTSTLQVKITDLATVISSNLPEYCNGVALRWIAPEALINGAYSTKSDCYSFGVTFWEILTYCAIRPHNDLDDEAFLQKIFSAYESYIHDLSNECSNNSIYYQATYASTILNGAETGTGVGGVGGESDRKQATANKSPPGTTRLSYRLALPRPAACPAEIYDLMLECWQLNEHIRPSFRDITQFLAARNNSNLNINNNNLNNQSLSEQIYA